MDIDGRVEVNLETEGRVPILPNCSEKQGHQGELGYYLAHAYKCGAPMQMHCTTTFLGNCWYCNRCKPEPHVHGHGAYGCRPLLFEKIPHYRMGIGTCNKSESQGHEGVKVILGCQQLLGRGT